MTLATYTVAVVYCVDGGRPRFDAKDIRATTHHNALTIMRKEIVQQYPKRDVTFPPGLSVVELI